MLVVDIQNFDGFANLKITTYRSCYYQVLQTFPIVFSVFVWGSKFGFA